MLSWFRRKPAPAPARPGAAVTVADDVEAAIPTPIETSPLYPSTQALIDGCKATEDLFARLKNAEAEAKAAEAKAADPPPVSPAAVLRAARPESEFASGDRSFQERSFEWAEPGTEARRIQDEMLAAQREGQTEVRLDFARAGVGGGGGVGGDPVPAELVGGYLGLTSGNVGGGHWFLSRGRMHPKEFKLFTALFRDMPHTERQRLYAEGGGALIRNVLLAASSRAFLSSSPLLWVWTRVRRLFSKR